MSNGFPKIQINVNIRESQGQILETSTLLNLRGDDLSEVVSLFHAARQQLEGVNKDEEPNGKDSNLRLIKESLPQRECPECGEAMLLRTAKNGKNPGKKFWGCSRYPMCETTMPC